MLRGRACVVEFRKPRLQIFETDDPFDVGMLEPDALGVSLRERPSPQSYLPLRLPTRPALLPFDLTVKVRTHPLGFFEVGADFASHEGFEGLGTVNAACLAKRRALRVFSC